MKVLLSLTLVFNLSVGTALASVKDDVLALGDIAMGYNVTKVKGTNTTAMLKKFFSDNTGEDVLVYKEAKDMDYGDEIEEGFTSAKSAKEMGGFAMSAVEEMIDNAEESEIPALKARLKKFTKQWDALINKLDKAGVKFGYSGNGPGYCGVSFVELIIIDTKSQSVYEVFLSESGSC